MTITERFKKARNKIGTHIRCAVAMDISGNTLQKCVDGKFTECTPNMQRKLKIWFKENKF